MKNEVRTAADYELEIEIIDSELDSLAKKTKKLEVKRYRLVAKRKQLDIAAALECIEETGVTIDDVLDLINKELTHRRFIARETQVAAQ